MPLKLKRNLPFILLLISTVVILIAALGNYPIIAYGL